MMRSIRFWNTIMAVAVVAAPLFAQAQDKPVPASPKLEQIDQNDEPAITIRKPETGSEITEKRDNGRVTQVKVNTGKSTYYIHPNDGPANVQPGDVQSPSVRPVEWVVHTWPRPKPELEEQPEPAPASPVPAGK